MAILLNDKYKPEERWRAVVEHGTGLFVVCAGPGTGKTYSLLRKIESLLELGTEPSQIYYLTFVNSIVDAFKADARKDKSEGGLGADPDELGIHISTLHSLAFKIVKVYSDKLDIPNNLEVLDLSPNPSGVLSQLLVDDIFEYGKQHGIVQTKKEFKDLIRQIADSWRKNIAPIKELASIESIISLFCQKYDICPWDKLVLTAIRAVTEFGLPKWLQGAQHFLIDEYQDFNPAEQLLIDLITEPSDSVVVVGDPDQSIYRGRSASPKGLLALLTRKDVESVNFVQCRRCSKNVLNAANRLLKYMDESGFPAKQLWPFKDEDGVFAIKEFKSSKAEIEAIAGAIKKLIEKGHDQIIILFPSNKARQFYFEKLSALGIPGSIKLIDSEDEIRFALLKLAIIKNHPFLERVAINRFKNLESKFITDALSYFLENTNTVEESLKNKCTENRWRANISLQLKQYQDALEKITSNDCDSIVQGLKVLSVSIAPEIIEALLETDESMTARERVGYVFDHLSAESDTSSEKECPVSFMSMHGAKGLSKQIVIIPAFEDKWLPGPKQAEELAEMHRLLYVAITRSKNMVLITCPRTRAHGDPLNYPVSGISEGISRYAKIIQPS